jgi:hypothetical protein
MATLTITAANVTPGAIGQKPQVIQAGETITAGMPVYLASTGKVMKASATLAGKEVLGIALDGAVLDGFVSVLKAGLYAVGASMSEGESFYLGATAGTIVQFGDLSDDDYVVRLFESTNVSGVALLDISDNTVTRQI